MEQLTQQDASHLIKIARDAISSYLSGKPYSVSGKDVPKKFLGKSGVFVTLYKFPGRELRGCIGIPVPEKPLVDAVVESAVNSATCDPRFSSISPEELGKIVIELTVLTKPEQIIVENPIDCIGEIKIGEHGLIVEHGESSGLLLPQVAVEQKWGETEFICNTCIKAGLPMDFWLNPATKIYKFSGIVFAETEPLGKVVKKKLTA